MIFGFYLKDKKAKNRTTEMKNRTTEMKNRTTEMFCFLRCVARNFGPKGTFEEHIYFH